MLRQFRAFAVSAAMLASAWPAGFAQEDGSDLVILLQSGLYRVGCLQREPNGVWGATSKAALGEFARQIGQTLVGLAPSQQALELVNRYDEQVCGVSAVSGEDYTDGDDLAVVTEAEAEPEPPAPEPAPAPAAPPEPVCIVATVNVGPKPGWGNKWDTFNNAPDIDFRETTTGSANFCNNSYSCQLQFEPSGKVLSFSIADDDGGVGDDDPIGSGQCSIGGQCFLAPSGNVTMSRC